MEEYITKTRYGYGLGVICPKIDDQVNFNIKGKFLKELYDNTFSGSEHEDPKEHIKKVLEIVNLFHILKGMDAHTRQLINSRGAIPTMKDADAKKAIHDIADYSQKWHNGTSSRRKRREVCKGPRYTKYCPNKEDGKTLKEAYYTQFGVPFPQGASVSVMPFLTNTNLGLGDLVPTKLIVKLADRTGKLPKGIAKKFLVVLENMDAYRDKEMGDVIDGKEFRKEI
nr:hypothetical protein [Tanacetum cinerariifolium]